MEDKDNKDNKELNKNKEEEKPSNYHPILIGLNKNWLLAI